jgi:hypothetical protein
MEKGGMETQRRKDTEKRRKWDGGRRQKLDSSNNKLNKLND